MTQDSMQLAAAESGLRFYQAYDQSLSLWPIESEAFYVSTRFGKTHIIASGPKDAPSLILLHGGSSALLCGIRISRSGAVNIVHMRSI